MPTPQKEATVAELTAAFEKSSGLYLCDFSGITAEMMNDLRGKIIESGGHMYVAKNRLLKIAFAGTPAEGLAKLLTGPTAVAFCFQDPIGPAQTMTTFAKTLDGNRRWDLKGAYVDGTVYDASGAVQLADLPPLEELRGMVVGAIAGPLNSLVGTLNGVASELVFTLQAVAEKRESQAA